MSNSEKLTAGKRAKQLGAPNERSLGKIAEIYGCSVTNLSIKFKDKPKQFDIIVLGCLHFMKQ